MKNSSTYLGPYAFPPPPKSEKTKNPASTREKGGVLDKIIMAQKAHALDANPKSPTEGGGGSDPASSERSISAHWNDKRSTKYAYMEFSYGYAWIRSMGIDLQDE